MAGNKRTWRDIVGGAITGAAAVLPKVGMMALWLTVFNIGLPAAGAWFLGGLAFHAAATFGTGLQLLAAGAAGASGFLLGSTPLGILEYFDRERPKEKIELRDYTTGGVESLCVPGIVAVKAVQACLSPVVKLSQKFLFAARKNQPPSGPVPQAKPITPSQPGL